MTRWQKLPKGQYHAPAIVTIDDAEDDLERRHIDYPDAPKDSFIISGPLPGGAGPGRAFGSAGEAWAWAIDFYGRERVLAPIKRAHPGGRWAIRVRPREVHLNDLDVSIDGGGSDANRIGDGE